MTQALRGKRVLVTGGAGMIGSYVVEGLVKGGARVCVVDNLATGRRENLAAVADDVRFVEADLRDRDACTRAVRGVEVVMNLAAQAPGFAYSMGHDAQVFANNMQIAVNVLDAARQAGVERFLAVSSSCVYPDDAPVPTAETAEAGEPESVNWGYGWAKRFAEKHAQLVASESEMHVAIGRPFNAYCGRYVWRDEQRAHVIPALVRRILTQEGPITIWGSGEQRRNFLHASDVAEILTRITARAPRASPVLPLNVGFEETVTLRELVEEVRELCSQPERAIVCDTSKPEGRKIKSADSTCLRSVIGDFEPRVTLRDGLQEMIAWARRSFDLPG